MSDRLPPARLYSLHELAFRTQYAELKERSRAAGPLLPGTPGTLYERRGTGHAYWYRVYYAAPGHQTEDLVSVTDLDVVRGQMAFAEWSRKQVSNLRKLEFQVADKGAARVLVELYNRGAFEAGLTMVGTLSYMAWLNELGVRAVAARTQDIDLARRQRLHLAATLPFLKLLKDTRLPFSAVPGFPSREPPTSAQLPGRDGLRVDVLVPGRQLGKGARIPELDWHGQAIPHYDYLLEAPARGSLLAGGHCIEVRLPQADRWLWHKLYASASRQGSPEKAAKDLLQAVTLAVVLVEQHDESLAESVAETPAAVRSGARARLPAIRRALAMHPQTLDQFELALSR